MFEVGAVAQFFFYGEGEEGLADGELLVDFGLGEAEVGYVADLGRVSDDVRDLGQMREVMRTRNRLCALLRRVALRVFLCRLGGRIGIGRG